MNHYCDRCGARAVSVWVKGEWVLWFCNHHLNVHEESIVSQGFEDKSLVG